MTARRVTTLLLVVLGVACLGFVGTAGAQSAPDCSAVGYETDASGAVEVGNLSQLQCMGNASTATSLSDDFVQVADIDASPTVEWNGGAGFGPIGNSSESFTGTFDGAGYTISNLSIDRPGENRVGLFGRIGDGGTVTDISLVGVNVTGADLVGGLVGHNSNGSIVDATTTGAVDGDREVGGLVGKASDGLVTDASATESVNGSRQVGGLVGEMIAGAVVTDSFATGPVTGFRSVGGLAGLQVNADSTVARSYATGSVDGSEFVGGLVGANAGGTATESYATGQVDGSDSVGGLVGFNVDIVTDSYAVGSVNGSSQVGGLVGENDGIVSESYWDLNTTDQSTGVGNDTGASDVTGLTTAQFRANDSLAGLDFQTIWGVVDEIQDGDRTVSYPFLRTNTQQPAPGLETRAGFYAGGNGSAAAPYEIANWTHLDNTRARPGGTFTLAADIDESSAGYGAVAGPTANGGAGFDPVGSFSTPFTGTLDGAGHTVSNLTIDRPGEDDIGLLGRIDDGGAVDDIALVDVDVTGTDFVGGLVGLIFDGNVTNASVTGSVDGSSNVGVLAGSHAGGTVTDAAAGGSVNGSSNVGGLVGVNDGGMVTDSTATASVGGGDDVGGLVGVNQAGGTVTDSSATGPVDGDAEVGGLVGSNGATLTAVTAGGSVNGSSLVGGLVGFNIGATVTDSSATGSANGSDFVGGLVGFNFDSTVATSYATGSADGLAFVGGFVGLNNDGTVTTSYATGPVNGSASVGGFAGANIGVLERSYAVGSVTGSTSVGGFLGNRSLVNETGTVTDSYWNLNTTGQASSAGNATGLLTPEMKGSGATARMGALDFTGTWRADTNATSIAYPVLRDNLQTPAPGRENRYDGGDGTLQSPYEVATFYHLDGLRRNTDANFTLVNDLDETVVGYDVVAGASASDGAGFAPIGTATDSFTGAFDGAGHAIANLTVDRPTESRVGLFGALDGSVTGVGLVAVDVTGDTRVGGLAGENSGTVTESYVTGSVEGSADVGGLAGVNVGGTVAASYATAAVTGSTSVGGLVGDNVGTVTETYAAGSVTGSTLVGGLAGRNDGSVSASYWDLNATGQDDSAGGTGLGTLAMKGTPATANMDEFGFTTTWDVRDPAADGLASYPFLRNNTQSPAPGAEQLAALSVGTFAGEFPNATAGEDYGTVGIPVTEAADVQTENLTVTLEIDGTGETFTFTGTNDTAVLQNETQSLPFDVGVIDQADTYTATVTADADNTNPVTASTNFSVGVAATPTLSALDIAGQGANATIAAGEDRNVSANVTNTGTQTGTFEVALAVVDGNGTTQVTANRTVTVGAGETTPVALQSVTAGLGIDADPYTVTVSVDGDAVEGALAVRPDVTGDGQPATDTTGDGRLDDVDGDGTFDIFDVQALFDNYTDERLQQNLALFDFDGNDKLDIFDVQALFNQL